MPDPESILSLLGPLAAASAIGLALGLEREMSHKPAGLRTQVLITVGATIFVLAGKSLAGIEVGRVAANLVTGLGFLGAGVILQHRGTVRGLTTAALIWVNGGLGMAVALQNYRLAFSGALICLTVLRLLGMVEARMGKKCRVYQYQVTSRESEEPVQAIHEALSHCHFREGPLAFDRREQNVVMRFAFCNPPNQHDEFLKKLRKMPDVMEVKVE